MEKKVSKQVRMQGALIARINRAAKADGSTFSQFIRTAAIEKLRRAKKEA